MLPDFPVLKDDLNKAITRVLQERARAYQGEIGNIRRARVFEGRRNVIVRTDGSEEETPLITSSAELSISFSELKDFDLPELLIRLDKIAFDIAEQQSRRFYEAMSEGIEKVGNTIDAQGGGITPELILKAFDTISIDFNSDGSPNLPTFHGNPAGQKAIESAMIEINTDPVLQRRFQGIMIKKREEWNAGEADRILVG